MDDRITRPGFLYYYDGLPAWTIRVPHPSRFLKVKTSIEFRSFLLPKGGLLACIFRLYDIPDQPFYVHRVFDISETEVSKYLKRSTEAMHWVAELKGGGEDQDVIRILPLEGTNFEEGSREVLNRNKRLGKRLDGASALRKFLDLFEPAAKDGGWEAGWKAVQTKFERT